LALARRIAYVTSAFPYLSETFVLREVAELERRGWDVQVFALKPPPLVGTHAEAARWIPRVHLPALRSREVLGANAHYLLRRPLRLAGLWAQALWWHRSSLNFALRVPVILLRSASIARELERRDIGHVHAHFATHPTLAALAAARLSGASFSVTVHAHDIFVRQTGLRQKLSRARFVACISQFNRQFLLDRYPDLSPQSLILVRCGVDPRKFAPASDAPRPLPAPPPAAPRTSSGAPTLTRILCVASLQEYKGVQVLLEACARLVDQVAQFECLLVGAGPLRPELEARAHALRLTDRVQFLGPQPEERVAELVRQATIFVAPSIVARDGQMDGIPVALMEALASGVPVVASDLSGIPELVRHEQTGLLVPPGNPEALALAIARLANDQALAERLATQGREHVRREFDLETNTALLADLFQDALAFRESALANGAERPLQAGGTAA
jgi:colanic acid/amylovoran biosynthesis glycosyltransferase